MLAQCVGHDGEEWYAGVAVEYSAKTDVGILLDFDGVHGIVTVREVGGVVAEEVDGLLA
jgi:hypothetical protein